MRDKVNRGHYMQVVNSMDPAAWWEAEDVSQGSVSSWMGRKATELVQATGEDQPETGKAPTGIPGIFFDGQFVALAFGLFDGESEFSVASTASHDGVAAQGAVIIQRDGDWWNTVSGMLQQIDSNGRTGSAAKGNATNWKIGTAQAGADTIQSRIDLHDLNASGPNEIGMYYNGVRDLFSSQTIPNNTVAVGSGVTDVGGSDGGTTVAWLIGWIVSLIAFYRILEDDEILFLDNLIAWQANI